MSCVYANQIEDNGDLAARAAKKKLSITNRQILIQKCALLGIPQLHEI
jgi:hypothetical protein